MSQSNSQKKKLTTRNRTGFESLPVELTQLIYFEYFRPNCTCESEGRIALRASERHYKLDNNDGEDGTTKPRSHSHRNLPEQLRILLVNKRTGREAKDIFICGYIEQDRVLGSYIFDLERLRSIYKFCRGYQVKTYLTFQMTVLQPDSLLIEQTASTMEKMVELLVRNGVFRDATVRKAEGRKRLEEPDVWEKSRLNNNVEDGWSLLYRRYFDGSSELFVDGPILMLR